MADAAPDLATPQPAKTGWRDFTYLKLWREAWVYAGDQKRSIIAYHLLFTVAVGVQLLSPYFLGQLVNTLQKAGPNLFEDCSKWLGLIILSDLVFWLMHGPGRVMERKAGQHVMINATREMFRKLTDLPLGWHQDNHSGATINRINKSARALQEFVDMGFNSFQRVLTLAGSIGILLWFEWRIGLISLVGFVLSMLLILRLNRKMTEAIHESNEIAHSASATFFDFVSNIVSIIILRLQKFSESTLAHKLVQTLPPFMREVKINEWRYFIYTMLSTGMMAAILLGYIWTQMEAGLAIAAGTLVTIYMYQDKVSRQGFDFIWTHSHWLSALTSLRAARTITDAHDALVADTQAQAPGDWREISIRNLSFMYRAHTHAKRVTLSDINLDIRRGERIALIGTSGAGKSTLLALLRAMHSPLTSDVTLDGQPSSFSVLSNLTTLIPQDPEIFENNIRFNVTFGLEVDDSEIMKALSLAEFDKILAQMPHGLDTDIREKGVNLSVGQKQRLALARGIFAAEQSDIILLDEPTSSIDLPTEERIFKNLFAHFEGKTIIATLHRLHLLPKFDRIIFLDAGRITADLQNPLALRQDGPIRQLYAAYQEHQAQ